MPRASSSRRARSPRLPGDAQAVLTAAREALDRLPADAWNHTEIEEALRDALIDGLGLKPRVAFGPVRTAISGRRVSPPLFESMQILGKIDSVDRIDRLMRELALSARAPRRSRGCRAQFCRGAVRRLQLLLGPRSASGHWGMV